MAYWSKLISLLGKKPPGCAVDLCLGEVLPCRSCECPWACTGIWRPRQPASTELEANALDRDHAALCCSLHPEPFHWTHKQRIVLSAALHGNSLRVFQLWFCASINPTTEDWNRCFRSVCVSNSSALDSKRMFAVHYHITNCGIFRFKDVNKHETWENTFGNRWDEHDSEQSIFYSIYLSTYIIIVRLSMFLKEFSPRLHFFYSKHS